MGKADSVDGATPRKQVSEATAVRTGSSGMGSMAITVLQMKPLTVVALRGLRGR